MPVPPEHELLIRAFENLPDKTGLGWVALDTKLERFVVAAIASAINRDGRRIAHLELRRGDLVILEEPLPRRPNRPLDVDRGRIRIRYEAKAGQLFDFAPGQGTKPPYLGGLLNDDLAETSPENVAGLFFISDPDDPSRHLKYYKGNVARVDDAVAILQKHVTNGTLVARSTIDCGVVDGTRMRIHMIVFDQLPAAQRSAKAAGAGSGDVCVEASPVADPSRGR